MNYGIKIEEFFHSSATNKEDKHSAQQPPHKVTSKIIFFNVKGLGNVADLMAIFSNNNNDCLSDI